MIKLEILNYLAERIENILWDIEEGDTVYGYCLDGLDNGIAQVIRRRDKLTAEDLELWKICAFGKAKIDANLSPLDSVIYATNRMRECSHGACTAKKIFVSKKLYDSIAEQAGAQKGKEYKLNGAKLLQSEVLSDNTIICVAEPKFRIVPPENLLIKFTIEE